MLMVNLTSSEVALETHLLTLVREASDKFTCIGKIHPNCGQKRGQWMKSRVCIVCYEHGCVKDPSVQNPGNCQRSPWVRLREMARQSPGLCVKADRMSRSMGLQLPPPGFVTA